MTSGGPDASTRRPPSTGTDRTHREARDRAAARTVARRSAARYEPHLDGLFTYCLSVLCDHEAATAALADALHLAERRDRYVRTNSAASARGCTPSPAGRVCARWPRPGRTVRLPRRRPLRQAARLRRNSQDATMAEQERRRRELAALAGLRRGASGTSPEQREALELAVRHRLAAHEVAAVLGMAPAAARELLATAACEVERTRAALAVVETGACPGVAHLTQGMVLPVALGPVRPFLLSDPSGSTSPGGTDTPDPGTS
ncbi:Sigma-70 family RNA polymerase sigma factor OS=Streptomyces tendae OX=1932 GN=F3L20_02055 PE=4 SV=1 [Streptomyces tendae]